MPSRTRAHALEPSRQRSMAPMFPRPHALAHARTLVPVVHGVGSSTVSVAGNVVVGALASQQGPSQSRIVVALQGGHEFSAEGALSNAKRGVHFAPPAIYHVGAGHSTKSQHSTASLAKPIVLHHHGPLGKAHCP